MSIHNIWGRKNLGSFVLLLPCFLTFSFNTSANICVDFLLLFCFLIVDFLSSFYFTNAFRNEHLNCMYVSCSRKEIKRYLQENGHLIGLTLLLLTHIDFTENECLPTCATILPFANDVTSQVSLFRGFKKPPRENSLYEFSISIAPFKRLILHSWCFNLAIFKNKFNKIRMSGVGTQWCNHKMTDLENQIIIAKVLP